MMTYHIKQHHNDDDVVRIDVGNGKHVQFVRVPEKRLLIITCNN